MNAHVLLAKMKHYANVVGYVDINFFLLEQETNILQRTKFFGQETTSLG